MGEMNNIPEENEDDIISHLHDEIDEENVPLKILLDGDGYLIGYASIGDIDGSIESNLKRSDIPTMFNCYKYIDGVLVVDEDKLREEEEKLNQPPPLTDMEKLQQDNQKLKKDNEDIMSVLDTILMDLL